ncbi:copper resistance protein [Salmonella enterica]|nr:copper resistance protein [Salmonella enterica]
MFHAIVSIKNDGHYFPGTGAHCTDGLNVTLTIFVFTP